MTDDLDSDIDEEEIKSTTSSLKEKLSQDSVNEKKSIDSNELKKNNIMLGGSFPNKLSLEEKEKEKTDKVSIESQIKTTTSVDSKKKQQSKEMEDKERITTTTTTGKNGLNYDQYDVKSEISREDYVNITNESKEKNISKKFVVADEISKPKFAVKVIPIQTPQEKKVVKIVPLKEKILEKFTKAQAALVSDLKMPHDMYIHTNQIYDPKPELEPEPDLRLLEILSYAVKVVSKREEARKILSRAGSTSTTSRGGGGGTNSRRHNSSGYDFTSSRAIFVDGKWKLEATETFITNNENAMDLTGTKKATEFKRTSIPPSYNEIGDVNEMSIDDSTVIYDDNNKQQQQISPSSPSTKSLLKSLGLMIDDRDGGRYGGDDADDDFDDMSTMRYYGGASMYESLLDFVTNEIKRMELDIPITQETASKIYKSSPIIYTNKNSNTDTSDNNMKSKIKQNINYNDVAKNFGQVFLQNQV
jgi:hypothetical protein